MRFKLLSLACDLTLLSHYIDAVSAGAGGHWLLHAVCVHADICSARHLELESSFRRTVWHRTWTSLSVRSCTLTPAQLFRFLRIDPRSVLLQLHKRLTMLTILFDQVLVKVRGLQHLVTHIRLEGGFVLFSD